MRQALIEIAYEVHLSDVKTDTGRRTIDIDPGTIDVLKAWRIERAEENGGIDPRAEDLVFPSQTGHGSTHRASARSSIARSPSSRCPPSRCTT